MRVSLNTIKQYIDFELPSTDELVQRINAQLGGVEEVIHLGAKYKDARIVKVVECGKHPNADRLSVCMIDDGSSELVQVVCGAPNVHTGMWAVWLPPESIVPSTYGTDDEFTLGARELRGKMSNGMLASARELGIGDDHSGIVEIDAEEWKPSGVTIEPGVSFAQVYGLDDVIIDIENKMFTHRPDLFGQLGVAREIAGIFGHQFKSPEWYMDSPTFASSGTLPLNVFNDAAENVPRFMAVAYEDVTVKPSPLWLQIELMRLGSKSINNIVDVTNYIMLLTAQPVHAYDYDKLRGQRLGARMAKKGETVALLNHKTYELSEDDIVIADGEGPMGLAGIMGGFDSEVTVDTKNVVLEVANFDMYAVRKSSMRHGIFTDALTRFNKGQSPFQDDRVLNLLAMSLVDAAGGTQASDVFDIGDFNSDTTFVHGDDTSGELGHSVTPQEVSEKFINDRLGLKLSKNEIAALLENVEFKVSLDAAGLAVRYPFWRTDIDEPEDIVEEVGRLYGFDKLPRELPWRSIKPAKENPNRELMWSIREILARAGANEVLTYSFVHETMVQNAGQDASNSYRLANALSPELQYYRQSLTPSLLSRVHANSKAGYDEFAFYELNKIHDKASGLTDEGVPVEHNSLALVYASKKPREGAAFYQAKAFLRFMAKQLGVQLAFEPLGSKSTSPTAVTFEPKRSAVIVEAGTGKYVGVIGEYTALTANAFKLPVYTAGFELDIDALLRLASEVGTRYTPLSRFPSVERDMSLQVSVDRSFCEVEEAVMSAFADTGLSTRVAPASIYQTKEGQTKNIAFRIQLTSPDRTLKGGEVAGIMESVARKLEATIGAIVV